MKRVSSGGGWPAIRYTLAKAREAGGIWKLYRALRTRNTCKTCALGMGGQRGGMVNEVGQFPEVCKKSVQAMVADMQAAVPSEFWDRHSPQDLQALSPRELEHCGRLVEPVLFQRATGRFSPIAWDDALNRVVTALDAADPQETFWYFSGRSSNEAGFLLQLLARLYGTNNINNCSYYCHQASGVGLTSVTGSGTATIVLEDVEQADLVFVIGGNPPSNHPRLMRSLIGVRRRGGKVIVVNPLVETGLVNFRLPSDVRSLLFGSEVASVYVQPHIGGDLAFFTGLAKRIDELGAVDDQFLQQACVGWEALSERLRSLSWEELCAKSGVSHDAICEVAETYAASQRAVFSWTMGITHHAHGVENVQAIANLALLRGMVGRPGVGLLPIRGHSNVQGMGTVGVTPQLKQAVLDRVEALYGRQLPTTPGRDTMACMEGAAAGELKVGFCLGGNLYGSNPDAKFAAEALSNLKLLVYLNTTLNTGHAFGLAEETLILPVLARDEEPQPTTQESMFNFVRLSDGGPRRHAGPRSEVQVVATIAEQLLGNLAPADNKTPIDWSAMRRTSEIRQAIAAVVPGMEKLASVDQTKEEFQIGGRTFHTPEFATEDGRARLHAHELPSLAGQGEGELRLMTIRSEGQFNTVVYEDHDLYRGVAQRDSLLLHPEDIARLGLRETESVEVVGPAGSMGPIRIAPTSAIRPGNAAMYYPEANAIVGRRVDPKSKTPAFKGVVVTVRRWNSPANQVDAT